MLGRVGRLARRVANAIPALLAGAVLGLLISVVYDQAIVKPEESAAASAQQAAEQALLDAEFEINKARATLQNCYTLKSIQGDLAAVATALSRANQTLSDAERAFERRDYQEAKRLADLAVEMLADAPLNCPVMHLYPEPLPFPPPG